MNLKLKEFRAMNKLTQDQVSKAIGIDRRQYSRYENGTNELPIRYLYLICINFNVSADYILGISNN